MKEFIEKLKEAMLAASYEDRAGRSVVGINHALAAIDRVAAGETLYSAEEIKKSLDGVKGACSHGVCEEVLEDINRLAAEQEEQHGKSVQVQ